MNRSEFQADAPVKCVDFAYEYEFQSFCFDSRKSLDFFCQKILSLNFGRKINFKFTVVYFEDAHGILPIYKLVYNKNRNELLTTG